MPSIAITVLRLDLQKLKQRGVSCTDRRFISSSCSQLAQLPCQPLQASILMGSTLARSQKRKL